MDYLHFNLVKQGLVNSAVDWPYSSFHCHVKNGIYTVNWTNDNKAAEMGEMIDTV